MNLGLTRAAAPLAALLLLSCGSGSTSSPNATPTPTATPSTPAPSTGGGVPVGNHAPTVALTDVQPRSPALSGGTAVTFAAEAHDDDGDAVTVTWDFGDGDTTEGTGVSHVFKGEGDHHVTLVAIDRYGVRSTEADTTITVKNLTGSWHGAATSPAVRLLGDIQQGGSGFSGHFAGGISVEGRVSDPRDVQMDVSGLCPAPVRFRGSMDESLGMMTLKAGDNCAAYKELQLFR